MRTKELILITCVSVLLAFVTLSDDSEAITYGSDEVGAHLVTFDPNGGTGGYSQYVLNGNSVYCPSERDVKADGIEFPKVIRNGHVLLGWSSSDTATEVNHIPGGLTPSITRDTVFYAVWSDVSSYNEHYSVAKGSSFTRTYDNDAFSDIVTHVLSHRFNPALNGYATITVNKDGGPGHNYSISGDYDETSAACGPLTARWDVFDFSGMTFSGTLDEVGTYVFTVWYQAPGEVITAIVFAITVYDTSTDPSDLCSISYTGENKYATDYDFILYAPYNTAIKLPDSSILESQIGSSDITERIYPNGWVIDVNGAEATFPLGGAYTLNRADTNMVLSQYDYDDVIESGFIGVLAYNSNGGTYNDDIAQIVGEGRLVVLKGDSSITKDGFTLIGWNATGNPSDPIYPFGYTYMISETEDYIELMAVWVDSASAVSIKFSNPGDSTQDKSYSVYRDYTYHFPEHGITYSDGAIKYRFKGWSTTSNDPGEGEPILSSTFVPTAAKTYYAVFEQTTYEYTIRYNNNGGDGSMEDSHVITEDSPYTMSLSDCTFSRSGYDFLGWATTPTSDSPTVSGNRYTFSEGSQIVTLYAIWSLQPTDIEGRIAVIQFNGNGNNVSGMPSIVYSMGDFTTSTHTLAIPNTIPLNDGYEFLGWTITPDMVHGQHIFYPGGVVDITFIGDEWVLGDGYSSIVGALTDENVVFTLYAVWSSSTGVDGTKCTVTFTGPSGTIKVSEVYKGRPVPPVSYTPNDGYAVAGWVTSDGDPWDFTSVVMEDITLSIQMFRVFSLTVDGDEVTIVLDDNIVSKKTSVKFTDGKEDTFAKRYTHTIQSSGTAYVTVLLDNGSFTAKAKYAPSEEPGEDPEQGDDPDIDDADDDDPSNKNLMSRFIDSITDMDVQIVGAIAIAFGFFGILFAFRRF